MEERANVARTVMVKIVEKYRGHQLFLCSHNLFKSSLYQGYKNLELFVKKLSF